VSWLVLACAFASVAAPLCIVRYVPFVDYPEHLSQIAAVANIDDPRFSPYYVLSLAKSQYFSFYLPATLLAKVVGTEPATRIVVVAGLAGLPLAVAAYLAAHKRSVVPAALAAFVALNVQTFWGFLNFALGVSIGILGLAAHARLVDRPSTRRTAWFALAALVCFYAHPYAYAWLVIACLLQTLCMLPSVGWRQAVASAWRAVVAGVPSVLALLFWLHSSQVLEHGEASARIDLGPQLRDSRLTFNPPAENVAHWRDQSFGFYNDGSGTDLSRLFLGAIGALLVLRIVLWGIGRRRGDNRTTTLAPEAVLALSCAAFVFAPESYKLVAAINSRFIVVALALLPVLAPALLSGRVRAVVAVDVIGLLTYHGAVHVRHFRELDAEMGDLDEALARTVPGKRLLGLIFDPFSALVPLGLYAHGHQYYQARVGGMAAWGFVELAHSPIAFRPGAAPPPFPWGWEWNPGRFEWDRWGPSFEYILVRTQPGQKAPWLFRSAIAGSMKPSYDGSRWKLYERLTPEHRPVVDPGPDDLVVRDEVVGAGPQASLGDTVSVLQYPAMLMDGTPALRTGAGGARRLTFKLGTRATLEGVDRGVREMKVGGKRELILPQSLAYGGNGVDPDVPPGAGLILEVELLDVRHP
jgi:hypothetical protein